MNKQNLKMKLLSPSWQGKVIKLSTIYMDKIIDKSFNLLSVLMFTLAYFYIILNSFIHYISFGVIQSHPEFLGSKSSWIDAGCFDGLGHHIKYS